MIKKCILFIFLCGCALIFTACGSTDEADESVLSNPQNVVALSESNAEQWILAGGELKGATDDALEILELDEAVESVGTVSSPSIEAIVALEPDMVLLTGDIPTHKEVKRNLEEKDIYCYTVDINSFDEYLDVLVDFTEMTGRDDLYEKNGLDVEKRVDDIKAEINSEKSEAETNEDTYLLLKASSTKNKAVNGDNFVCEILDDMGLVNIASEESYLDEISLEAVAKENPTYIFVITMGETEEAISSFERQFKEKPVWAGLDAVKAGNVHILPKELFQYKPNNRWDEAYEYIYELCGETK